jgi:hypothetical protein
MVATFKASYTTRRGTIILAHIRALITANLEAILLAINPKNDRMNGGIEA